MLEVEKTIYKEKGNKSKEYYIIPKVKLSNKKDEALITT